MADSSAFYRFNRFMCPMLFSFPLVLFLRDISYANLLTLPVIDLV